MKRFVVGAVGLVVLAGCAPKEVNYKVNIVTQSCDMSSNPFQGVQFLRVRVTGDGIATPLDAVSGVNSSTREIKIPEIPSGLARVIEVRGYEGDPAAGGRVVSVGKSLPFDVPNVVPEELMGKPIDINVVLRKINSFSPPVSAAAPTQCQRMKVARAGHTATLLKNGKVFIAGGYNLKAGSPEKAALSDAELYNPATGAFESARDLSITSSGTTYKLPRAYHAAIRLPSGQVMLWGGEVYASGVNNVVSPIASILFYDPDVDDFGAVGPRSPVPAIARTRHSVAMDENGKVLVVGGLTRSNSLVPVEQVEWIDPVTNLYKIVDGVTLPRIDSAVAAVKKGEFIAVAGGTDGTNLKTEITFFKFTGSTFGQQTLANPPRLGDPGRRSAGVATLRDSADMILLGGYSDPTLVKPVASSEIVNSSSATVAMGPAVGSRGETCALTLSDGSVMAIGGRTSDMPNGPSRSDAAVIFVKANPQGGVTSLGAPDLPTPRYGHTCTALADGTVLVTGGINESLNGTQEILQDAWIYQPAPVDSPVSN